MAFAFVLAQREIFIDERILLKFMYLFYAYPKSAYFDLVSMLAFWSSGLIPTFNFVLERTRLVPGTKISENVGFDALFG